MLATRTAHNILNVPVSHDAVHGRSHGGPLLDHLPHLPVVPTSPSPASVSCECKGRAGEEYFSLADSESPKEEAAGCVPALSLHLSESARREQAGG